MPSSCCTACGRERGRPSRAHKRLVAQLGIRDRRTTYHAGAPATTVTIPRLTNTTQTGALSRRPHDGVLISQSLNVRDLPIGLVAKRAGVGVQTVRYYERRGLLPQPARRHSGHRAYTDEIVDLLRSVKAAQRLGFTLVKIEEILRLASRKAKGSNLLQERMRDKVLEIDGKFADALHAGCDSLTNCTCPACPFLVDEGKGEARRGKS